MLMYVCMHARILESEFLPIYMKQYLTHDRPQTSECEQSQIIIFLAIYTQSSVSEKQRS